MRQRTLPPLKAPRLATDGFPCAAADTDFPILGVDASVGKAGFCLIHRGVMVTWKHVIADGEGPDRLIAWRTYMSRLLREYGIGHVVIEGYSYGSRNGRQQSTGEVGGVHRLVCNDSGAQLLLASPGTVKKFATGNGGSPKTAIPLGLYKKYDIEITNEDEADAASLALLGQAYWNPDRCNLLKYQKDAVKGIEPYIVHSST